MVEIQHSPISPDVIAAREEFYGDRMAWIFDATQAALTVRAAPPVLANRPCGCTHEQCAKIWLQPGTACICGHDGCRGYMEPRRWEPSPEVRFRWKHARRSLTACRRPVFLDLGIGAVLRPGRFDPAGEMTGALYTRSSVEDWLRDGTGLYRVVLPPQEPVSRYDPSYMEWIRTPGAATARDKRIRRWIFGADVPSP